MLPAILLSLAFLSPDLLGSSIAAIPDLDGDGVLDLVVADGAPPFVGGEYYGASVHSGADGVELFKLGQGLVPGLQDRSIATGFDYDKDGVQDFALVGVQPFSAMRGMIAIHIYSVGEGRVIRVLEIPSLVDDGVYFLGVADVTEDGVPDFALAGRVKKYVRASERHGQMFFSGVDGSLVRDWNSGAIYHIRAPHPAARSVALTEDLNDGLGRLCLRSLDDGCLVMPLVGTEGFAGTARFVGDLSGDGVQDVLTSQGFLTSISAVRTVSVFDSRDGTLLWQRKFESGIPSFSLEPHVVGDVDRDGTRDIALVSWATFASCNRLEVFSMRADASVLKTCQPGNGHQPWFGTSVCGLGDVDCDGVDDIAVGSCRPDAQRMVAGRCDVFSGESGELLYSISN